MSINGNKLLLAGYITGEYPTDIGQRRISRTIVMVDAIIFVIMNFVLILLRAVPTQNRPCYRLAHLIEVFPLMIDKDAKLTHPCQIDQVQKLLDYQTLV